VLYLAKQRLFGLYGAIQMMLLLLLLNASYKHEDKKDYKVTKANLKMYGTS